MRASDADREAVVERLHDAVLHGLLTVEEGGERVQDAYAARHLDELPRLTADLPPRPEPAPAAPGWRSVASAAALQTRMSLLGAPTWRAADPTRRWVVAAGTVLLALLLVALVIGAVAFAGVHHPEFYDRGPFDRGPFGRDPFDR